MMARSYYAAAGGGLRSLELRTREVQEPAGRQILVRVIAVSLNYRERMIIVDDAYPLPVKRPWFIPVCDGACEVVATGPQVTRVRVGDRVAAAVFPRWLDGRLSVEVADQLGGSLDGTLTEYMLLDEDAAVHIPPHLSYEEAATFPCAGVTAWHALTSVRTLLPGEDVLVLGTGGVALFAVQFAKLFGARVIATTSSPAKARILREIGADDVVDYSAVQDWHLAVRELTGGRGVDRIVEIGGADTIARSVASIAIGGIIALVGAFGGEGTLGASALRRGVYTLQRVALGNRAHFLAMNRAVGRATLRPLIERVFPFERVPEGFAHFFERSTGVGKVVIRMWEGAARA